MRPFPEKVVSFANSPLLLVAILAFLSVGRGDRLRTTADQVTASGVIGILFSSSSHLLQHFNTD